MEYRRGVILTGDVGAVEVLESSSVVEVKMAHDDSLHVPDVVAGSFDSVRKLHLLGVNGAREKISERRTCLGQYTSSYYRLPTVLKYSRSRHPQHSRSRTGSSPCADARSGQP
jgi:hypothetical protein